ncbi:MAG: YceI family protein [Phycisphaerae bacterium]|nr:YceI family protein [Phycisphaerae bacterium]
MYCFSQPALVAWGRQRTAPRRVEISILAVTLVVWFAAAATTLGAAMPTTRYLAAPSGSSLIIKGTSTLHDWSVKTTALSGGAVLAQRRTAAGKAVFQLRSIHLTIVVKSLKSSEGGGMDDTMYDALNRRQHPVITYHLTKASLINAPAGRSTPCVFNTTGTLMVNGVARTIHLPLQVQRLKSGGLTITTEIQLKMTTFGVKPPTAMFGIIHSGDAIKITATWRLKASARR